MTDVPSAAQTTVATKPVVDAEAERKETGFFLYTIACGDLITVARHLNTSVAEVRGLARVGQWEDRVRMLAKAGQVGDLEPKDFDAAQKELNRAVNYVQAHKLRRVADRLLAELGETEGSLLERLTTVSATGSASYDLKPLADIARVMEISHRLSSNAIGDLTGAGIRAPGRQPGGGSEHRTPPSTGRAALSVGRAMAAIDANPAASSAAIASGD